MAEVNSELAERFRRHEGDSAHFEAVIVTLEPGGNVDELSALGMKVRMSTRNGLIAAGTVTREVFDAVTRLEWVRRIEADGEMHAMG
jgi:hypothetical protein